MRPCDHQYDPGNRAGTPTLSRNLLPPILGLIGIGVLACAVWAWGLNDSYSELLNCAARADGPARLACYDQLAAPHQPARGAIAPVQTHPQRK